MKKCPQPMPWKGGFAISIDAFFALILLIGLIGFIGTGNLNAGEQVPAIKVSTLGQNLEDAFTSFENTGFLTQELNPTLDQCKINEIYEGLNDLLPINTDANIKITRYTPKTEAVDLDACRAAWIAGNPGTFDLCFDTPTENDIFVPYKNPCPPAYPDACPTICQPEIPENTEVIAGRKLIMQKQAGNRVGAMDKCTLSGATLQGVTKKFYPKLYFADGNTDENVTFTLNSTMKDQQTPPQNYSPINALGCYDPTSTPAEQETQVVDVTLKAYSGARYPVSVMMVNDRSGSMSGYDMLVKTTSGTAAAGDCNGVACFQNCSLSNKDTEYSGFTNKKDVITYDLAEDVGTGNKIYFSVTPNGSPQYSGYCPAGSMVLWVRKPDSSVEKDYSSKLAEDVISPPMGTYTVELWDDSLEGDSYSGVYVSKYQDTNASGQINCSTSWQNIGDSVVIPASTTFVFRYFFSYSGNFSSGNNPQFRVTRNGTSVGTCNGNNNADSGSCIITLQNNGLGGPFETAGTFQAQARTESVSGCYMNPFNVSVGRHVEACFTANCSPIKSADVINGGTCNSIACGNCPFGTDSASSNIAKGVRIADNYTVDANTLNDHKRGIYADINSITVDAAAVCKAGIGFRNPITAESDSNNFYFSLNPGSNSFCFQRVISGEGTECSDDRHNFSPVPLPSGDYNVLAWSDKSLSYNINWKTERIDVAKSAAKMFLDKAHAEGKPQDLFGLVSFSDNVNLDMPMTNDVELVKGALNSLVPSGYTKVSAGINTARNNIGTSENQRFIILLTDGIANRPNDGTHHSWTTADSSTISCSTNNPWPSGCSTTDCCRAVSEAIYEATVARSEPYNTTIFVVGISEQAVFSTDIITSANPDTLYVEAMKDLAKDATKYASVCYDALGNLKESERCGRFYYASDEDSLQEIYDLIMEEIGKRTEAVDIKIQVPAGTEILCDSNCAGGMYCEYSAANGGTITCASQTSCTDPPACDGEDSDSWYRVSQLIYTAQNINFPPWVQTFKSRIPCDISQDACEASSVTFPTTASLIHRPTPEDIAWEPDTVNEPPKAVCETEEPPSCNTTVPFNFKDLKIVFSDGTVITNGFGLTLKIGNKGYKPITFTEDKPLRISFHSGSANGPRLSPVEPFSGQATAGFTTTVDYNSDPGIMANELLVSSGTLSPIGSEPPLVSNIEIKGILMTAPGDIYATIDETNILKQCPKGDTDYISCWEPITYYYVVDYVTWGT